MYFLFRKGRGMNVAFAKCLHIILIAVLLPLIFMIYVTPLAMGSDGDTLSEELQSAPGAENLLHEGIWGDQAASGNYLARKALCLKKASNQKGFNNQSARLFLDMPVEANSIEKHYKRLIDAEKMDDFAWCSFVRFLYLDREKDLIPPGLKNDIIEALLKSKYWFTESTETNTAIVYTENHQILCHSSEYLIGQMFPDEKFSYSGMTGREHVEHAKAMILRWLEWRGKYGFSEWNSNDYLNPDISSLLNLVDFAQDPEIAVKSAILLDLITFNFSCHYFKGQYATSMGRCYDRSRTDGAKDPIAATAWLLLGVGEEPERIKDRATLTLASSKRYYPPRILEEIAGDNRLRFEHRECQSINLSDGPNYGLSYDQNDIMFWLGMSGPAAPATIETTFKMIDKYNLDPEAILGTNFYSYFKASASLRLMSLSKRSEELRTITEGVCLEQANIYTFRTPDYQLSGVQDHKKGTNGMQEHIWQASLDDNAYVFTNSPGGITHKQQYYMGGWKPRAVFYRNVGIIQYDRQQLALDGNFVIFLLNLFTPNKAINHAYFPRAAFDEIVKSGKWVFARKADGYIGLYCHKPAWWASDHELASRGFKNLWLVELGSKDQCGEFSDFMSKIKKAKLSVTPRSKGYEVEYNSPALGVLTMDWDKPLRLNGNIIDVGPYARIDNDYCRQEFGTTLTEIRFGGKLLRLDTSKGQREYLEFQ